MVAEHKCDHAAELNAAKCEAPARMLSMDLRDGRAVELSAGAAEVRAGALGMRHRDGHAAEEEVVAVLEALVDAMGAERVPDKPEVSEQNKRPQTLSAKNDCDQRTR